ncbi:HAMP domain-containing protein [Prochlorothrix hollandica]|uniref:HAMP domain-containing protein n=1 Tax=Prochlorothrix hollandica TaxID=1223 RepID=UPI000344DFB3|nr:HAMP domain-containing protein [Prochlorothrix hollandica]
MRIAPKITLSSISLFTIIVVIVGGSNWLIQRSIRGVYSQQQQTQETLKSSLALETLIHEEIMTLKDFVVLGRKASDMVIYQRDRSNVLLALSELESLDVNPEVIALVRDRHTRLGQLANQVTRRSQSPSEVEQSLRAINSFRQDILLGLDTLLEESQGLEAAAETEGEQLRTLALWFQLVMLLGFIGIMLLEFKITFRPIIRSIETLQAGVTEFDVTKREYRLDIQSKDEIEEVAHAFNTMADRLMLAYSTLEDQVAVRTAEIHQKNRFLEQTLGELKETQLQLI